MRNLKAVTWFALSALSSACASAAGEDNSADGSGLETTPSAGGGAGGTSVTPAGGAGSAGRSNNFSGSTGLGGAGGSMGGAGGAKGSGTGGEAGRANGGSAGTEPSGTGGNAGGPGHVSANCPLTAQLCLDFEDNGYTGWTKKESGGKLSIDAAFASHGTHSLAIETPSGQRGGHLEAKGAPLFPLPAGKLWGRMMIYIDGVPDGHTNFASGSGPGGGAYNISEQHGGFMMSYYAGSAATDCWARPKNGMKVPAKTWSCWEWSFDSKNNQLQYWLDGASLVTVNGTGDGCLSGNGTWKAPSEFQTLQIGEEIQQPGGASKVWIDDVAVSNVERVGCPTK